MKATGGILFLLLIVCASPAFFHPTEDDAVAEPIEDTLKSAITESADTDADYSAKEETIDDDDLVDPSDDHPDGSESDNEAVEDPETGLSHDSVDPDETAAEVAEEHAENNEVSEVEERDGRQLKADSSNGTTESGRGRKVKPTRLGRRPAKKRPSRRKPARQRLAHRRKHQAHRRRPHKGRRPHRRPFHRRRFPVRRPVSRGRSSEVEQTNKLIDLILANFSATIGQKLFQEEIRITAIPEGIKILPWAYRTISITDEAILRAAHHVEDTESEVNNTADSCTDAVDVTGTNSTCTGTTNSTAEAIPEDNEELGPDNHIEEHETSADEKKPSGTEKEADNHRSEVEADDEDDHVYTKDPYPVLKGNETVEYYVQLLHPRHGSLFDERQQAANETVDQSNSDKLRVEDDDLNEVEPAAEDPAVEGRKRRSTGKKESKKPDLFQAVVTGLDGIKRVRDVKTVARNSLKIYRIHLSVGPLTVHFKEPVSSALYNQTSITTDEMPALLVVKERGGRLIASRFANKHATPYLAQVTLRRSSEDQAPDKLHTGRLVTHLSQELARIWNRGILISKINRQFKDLFINKKHTDKKIKS